MRSTSTDRAADWLRQRLASGPALSALIKAEATARGVAEKALARAVRRLDVVISRQGYQGQTIWTLPQAAAPVITGNIPQEPAVDVTAYVATTGNIPQDEAAEPPTEVAEATAAPVDAEAERKATARAIADDWLARYARR
jgi:hypothetical protein